MDNTIYDADTIICPNEECGYKYEFEETWEFMNDLQDGSLIIKCKKCKIPFDCEISMTVSYDMHQIDPEYIEEQE